MNFDSIGCAKCSNKNLNLERQFFVKAVNVQTHQGKFECIFNGLISFDNHTKMSYVRKTFTNSINTLTRHHPHFNDHSLERVGRSRALEGCVD